MVQFTSVAGVIGLLDEPDQAIQTHALQQLDQLVNDYWTEIADSVPKIEELYEDETFPQRQLAALVASKVFYHLGDFDESMVFALGAGNLFDISANSEYVQTIVEKCIDKYISLNAASDSSELTESSEETSHRKSQLRNAPGKADPRLESIVERMIKKCFDLNDFKPAIGIAIEARRLDVVERGIEQAGQSSGKGKSKSTGKDERLELMEYVLEIAMNVVQDVELREKLLRLLLNLYLNHPIPDYFAISKCVVHLEDHVLAGKLLKDLVTKGEDKTILIAYQIAFDLYSSSTQDFVHRVVAELPEEEPETEENKDEQPATENTGLLADDENTKTETSTKSPQAKYYKSIREILKGTKTIELSLEFLYRNNHIDMSILNKIRDSLEARNSIFHTAVTFANAFMNAGTTSDGFFRDNLDWLGKAVNWSKFSATAALGVIHKGHLSQGMKLLDPYLPKAGSASGSAYSQGGSLYALGLIYANHGTDVLEFLRNQFKNPLSEEKDIIQHGGALGLGVAAMATGDAGIYEDLKVVLWADSAVAGEAAGLAMGLIMLGSGNAKCLEEMVQYARETQHEKIIRGLALGMALINYGRESNADEFIKDLLDDADPALRYGGVLMIALAYCGTGSNHAVRKLLHVAVSDVNDDVRRIAVLSLGFILFRKPGAVPRMVELLSESYNPHVRYGATMALGIACAGTGLDEAIDLLEPMMKDPTDFVRQGAHIALAMILVQQTDQLNPKVSKIRKAFEKVIGEKHEDAMAKFGAALALGIIDAGGRNATISLQTQTGSLNMSGIVGMAIFTQYWYWFPLTHFLSLSFAPTGIIALNKDLEAPNFNFVCNTRPSLFDYPPVVEEAAEAAPEKVETAVLSTTAKARQRAKLKAKEEAAKGKDEMDIEPTTPAPASEEKMDIDEEPKEEAKEEAKEETKEGETKEGEAAKKKGPVTKKKEKEPSSYSLQNLSRVLPAQLKYISLEKDSRYVPVKKPTGGILLVEDTQPDAEVELLELKRKPIVAPATGGQTAGQASTGAATSLTGGAARAARPTLIGGSPASEEDAPVPEPFDYVSDSEN
ncbi:26S proteasome regulatory complex, non-ATPase subcomplex, Rpn2/Psmd1 subunit [Ascobolus immersus RN42]|uniref:26S proteasome regulatory subunit RPN2 n=1 Tax=Ascobolus immersus RN42 TaxID=1160509 RepID=A0A3N4I240_ASCIM|nr:26S proteasome regulatory complex, non-ATPase subcomplex, Rpn2/Psmd1 subunit [Ascobolus immersus RN42]